MTVSELLELLSQEKLDGHGEAPVCIDGITPVELAYDPESDTVNLCTESPVVSYEDLLELDADVDEEVDKPYLDPWDEEC